MLGGGVAGWRVAGALLALAVGALVLWLPPGGLEPRAVRFLAVLAAGTVLWAWGSFPDYVVGHRDARPFAWVYAAAVLAGFLVSLPYWRALGLVSG